MEMEMGGLSGGNVRFDFIENFRLEDQQIRTMYSSDKYTEISLGMIPATKVVFEEVIWGFCISGSEKAF